MSQHSVSKPHGVMIVQSMDGLEETDCLRCCHCGSVWKVVRGSGRIRGFCQKCMGPTCGCKDCQTCLPIEKRLDLYEAGKLAAI